MVKFLRSRGHTCITVSKMNVINYGGLSSQHVLLLNCYVDRYNNSAFVCNGGKVYHNFSGDVPHLLFFLNQPTQDVILVWRKEWKKKKKKLKQQSIPSSIKRSTKSNDFALNLGWLTDATWLSGLGLAGNNSGTYQVG